VVQFRIFVVVGEFVMGKTVGGFSKNLDRHEHDFYETPQGFTRALLDRLTFHNPIWEPAAGKCAIADVCEEYEYDVYKSDLVVRREDVNQENFLMSTRRGYDIITNPPFRLTTEFVQKAYELCEQRFAMVLPIHALGSKKRYKAIWNKLPLAHILLAGNYQFVKCSNANLMQSQFLHFWAIFDKGHVGYPTMSWTENEVFKPEL
jgi:hypothetical protein